MKDKILGFFTWEVLVGFLAVGIAGAAIVSFVRGQISDMKNNKPEIDSPPEVSIAPFEQRTDIHYWM